MPDLDLDSLLAAFKLQDEHDRADGIARFGGWLESPDYAGSYLQASRAILNHAQQHDCLADLAAPCIYLQRHTLELVLKNLLSAAYAIQAMNADLKSGVVTPNSSPNAPPKHNLSTLVELLGVELNKLSLEAPSRLVHLVTAISEFEDGDPTRLRYPRGRKARFEESSFPDQVCAPVVEWQSELEAIAADVGQREKFWEKEAREWTLGENLFVISESLVEELYRRGLLK